jgi:hypothetical protein
MLFSLLLLLAIIITQTLLCVFMFMESRKNYQADQRIFTLLPGIDAAVVYMYDATFFHRDTW